MNYLELFVFRPPAEGETPERGVATVIASGRDLFGALEHSVNELRKAGWAVDDVKKFITDYNLQHAQGNERLRAIYNRASDAGIDWYITAANPAALAVSA